MDQSLKLPSFEFDSPLTNLVIELDHLRNTKLGGTTPSPLFFDLKRLFHILESVQSARIEGNRTTVAEMIDAKIDTSVQSRDTEDFAEIENIEEALQFIDEHVSLGRMDRMFLSHLHTLVVKNLHRDGSTSPGEYRKGRVAIQKSLHTPPDGIHVEEYMDELIGFINQESDSKFDLLKVATAHHRFTWIHPFDNGNGRMSRLLTYAMLVAYGFNVEKGQRVLNPTGLFCINRERYYDMLADADQHGNEGLVRWCTYVLEGLLQEISKVNKLADYEYLCTEIVRPALAYAAKVESISPEEYKVLEKAATQSEIQARHLKELFPSYYPVKISRLISSMKEQQLLRSFPKPNSNSYVLSFGQSRLMRFIARQMTLKGFIMTEEETA